MRSPLRLRCLAPLLACLPACGSDGAASPVAASSDAAADSGGPVSLTITVKNVSAPGAATTSAGATFDVVFGPGVYAIHPAGLSWFEAGSTATPALEHLAEDGEPKDVVTALRMRDGFAAGVFGADVIDVSYDDAPIEPGASVDFAVTAAPGARLELGMMWSQSNDVFVATDPGGVPLFEGGAPRLGIVTAGISLWDAGTEVNQEPGVGDAQAPRQPAPGYGDAEHGVVSRLEDAKDAAGWVYPPLATTLEVSVSR